MNNQVNSSSSKNALGGTSALNIGVGMLIGLVIALIVAFFAMNSGPFRDKSNKNVLTAPQGGNTDPNASLYSTSVAPTTIPSSATPSNEQGAGVAALTDSKLVPSKQALADTSTAGGDAKTAVKDPISELISNKTPASTATDPNAPKVVAPKVVEPKPQSSTSNTSSTASTATAAVKVVTPKPVTVKPAEPKVIKPVTVKP